MHEQRSNRPRVLLVSGSLFQMGGMERVMQTVARELVPYGFDSEVVIPQQDIALEISDWFGQFGARVAISDELADLSAHGMAAAPRFAGYLRRRNGSLVNLHSPGPRIPLGELIASRMAGMPVVTSIHGFDARLKSSAVETWRNRLIGSPLSAAVIVMNQTVLRQQRSRGVRPDKLELVYNAVGPPNVNLTRAEARRLLGIPDSTFVIVSFCRIVRDKGLDVLLDAVAQLPSNVLDHTQLYAGGSGPELQYLRSYVQQHVREVVHFLGHVRDPSVYYTAADVLVAPSRHEPFGLVFLEAAQYGIPCVGTRVGGIPEVVVDGETGLLVEPENSQQLAQSIATLSRDAELRQRLGSAARARVRELYTLEAMVQGYARVFHKVLATRTGRHRGGAAVSHE